MGNVLYQIPVLVILVGMDQHAQKVVVVYIIWDIARVILIFFISAICTASCENEGQCIGPNTCNCTENWEGETCAIGKFENLISVAIYV